MARVVMFGLKLRDAARLIEQHAEVLKELIRKPNDHRISAGGPSTKPSESQILHPSCKL